ncbi:MAG: GNAT family N-acetyltransferase [Myxococcota bacterium]|nr:GNAT family N-acetyltransferase [Myxococcota bacterium]
MTEVQVRPLVDADVDGCAALLARLPEWFGIEASNRAYIAGLSELPAFVAEFDGRLVGFASLRPHGPASSEIEVLAVTPDRHRQGVGRALVGRLEAESPAGFLHVKTLGPSDPDANYARTRAFYAALGFTPLFESTALWGEENPTLVLVKNVR